MGKFLELYESTYGAHSPIKRTFKVHAKDEHGKDYTFDHESYSPRGVHKSARFTDLGHKLVAIKHGDKDVTNENTLEEGLRKVGDYSNGNHKATVHRDVEWGEYRVKHHIDGKHQTEADYHTDDKEEAHNHAKNFVSKAKNESVDTQTEDRDRSEHSANLHLANSHGGEKQHHIYVRIKGAKKNIAGPFRSKEEAEKHPARKWADGVHAD